MIRGQNIFCIIIRPQCWQRQKAGGEVGDDRGWDGWMASLTQWTWVWACFRSWWWTEWPGVLPSMASQRVRHGWATDLNWTDFSSSINFSKLTSVSFFSVCLCSISYNPEMFFSRTWKPSLWNAVIKKGSPCLPVSVGREAFTSHAHQLADIVAWSQWPITPLDILQDFSLNPHQHLKSVSPFILAEWSSASTGVSPSAIAWIKTVLPF